MLRTWMLAGMLMGSVARADELPEEAAPARNVVALEVGGLLQNTVGVSAERAVSERVSLRLGLRAGLMALWTHHERPSLPEGLVVSEEWRSREASVALEPGARVFFSGRAPEGFWAGPQLGLRLGWSRSVIEDSRSPQASHELHSRSLSASLGALAGYSAVLARGLTLQAAAGLALGYWRPLGERPQAGLGSAFSTQWSLQPVTQLSLGYAF
jgi:hypothetical protein